MKRVIVGIDPGTTTGIALLSLFGELLFSVSLRNPTEKEVIDTIVRHGKPVIVASDVPRAPEKVTRLARQLGAVLFVPQKEISQEEKEKIARHFGLRADDHVRDALAAAFVAFQSVKPKIDRVIKRIGEEEFVEGIVEKVLKGTQTAKAVEEEFLVGPTRAAKRQRTRENKEIIALRKKIGELIREKRELERRLEETRKRKESISCGDIISDLEAELARLRKERDEKSAFIRELEKEIERLRQRLGELEVLVDEIMEGVRSGLLIGPPSEVEGKEVLPGVFLGRKRKSTREKLLDMINEYREKRRKQLNVL